MRKRVLAPAPGTAGFIGVACASCGEPLAEQWIAKVSDRDSADLDVEGLCDDCSVTWVRGKDGRVKYVAGGKSSKLLQ